MEADFQILAVDETKGHCALVYKAERYFLTTKGGNEFLVSPKEDNKFLVWGEDGEERDESHLAVPSKDYMSYSEYFHSQEFKEAFISDMLKDALKGTGISSVRDYDGEYIRFFDEYFIEKRFHGVCYKNGKYHYLRTDVTGDLVEDAAFDNEAAFWEYLESTPYMQDILSEKYNSYRPKCVNGKYVGESPKFSPKNFDFWKEKILWKKRLREMSDKIVQRSKPVLKKAEIKRPVIKETDTVWLAVSEGDDTAYKYEFVCDSCEKKINLRTGAGRYGNLGGFRCPFCRKKYFAQIDDNPRLHVYIYNVNNMPAGYLDRRPGPLFELEMLEE